MKMRESNAARGHKLTRLSISAEEQEDLDLALFRPPREEKKLRWDGLGRPSKKGYFGN
jgi:hypothetical protein